MFTTILSLELVDVFGWKNIGANCEWSVFVQLYSRSQYRKLLGKAWSAFVIHHTRSLVISLISSINSLQCLLSSCSELVSSIIGTNKRLRYRVYLLWNLHIYSCKSHISVSLIQQTLYLCTMIFNKHQILVLATSHSYLSLITSHSYLSLITSHSYLSLITSHDELST